MTSPAPRYYAQRFLAKVKREHAGPRSRVIHFDEAQASIPARASALPVFGSVALLMSRLHLLFQGKVLRLRRTRAGVLLFAVRDRRTHASSTGPILSEVRKDLERGLRL
jgi:hypothetical protein